ncbi:MAG: FAD-dependent oxidoreductase [Phycisphaeraceae bacterium]|nr:MAG: FAD-dependent oxidoreductase [Phycisphaeraceae bacterium]
MGRVVVLGAGVSGHTAAAFLKKWLGHSHDVVVVSPKEKYNWIPSNIWVGVGCMKPAQVEFPIKPVYDKFGIEFHQARAVAIHPEGSADHDKPFVEIEYTEPSRDGERARLAYDHLINATGPKLNFGATKGLGPEGHSHSVCTTEHAVACRDAVHEAIGRMKKGERQRFLVGTGHGLCTCQGAAFEYVTNLEFVLRKHGVRDKAEITWLSNEYCLGDFGMGGIYIKRGGYITHSRIFTESLFAERGLNWIFRAHVNEVCEDRVLFETLDGTDHEEEFDVAMLLPPFAGVGLKAHDRKGGDITERLFAPNGFMKVDADYSAKPYEEWKASDWPRYYVNPEYSNLYAVGIAFAPPHPISQPRKSPRGTPIFATPPRTGMPSAMMGKAVASNIANAMLGRKKSPHAASMARMGAGCVASAGAGLFNGTAAAMTVYPVVPDFDAYPEYGRDLSHTFGEIGLAGHWVKVILHYMFMHKAQGKPGWTLIPE